MSKVAQSPGWRDELGEVATPALALAAACAIPAVLGWAGVDLGLPLELDELTDTDHVHRALRGAFVHTLLEWSACCVAVFTALLAFTHYLTHRRLVTPVIGIALLACGIVDAFHTLAADRIIDATSPNTRFIPFTWAISRVFNALILALGVGVILGRRDARQESEAWVVTAASVVFGMSAYATIHWSAASDSLPTTMFPDAAITRPWDVAPLVLYVALGTTLLPMLHRRMPTYFTLGLWLSVIPHVATQLHMSFGSAALFDHHFNAGHLLKVVAYVVPLASLVADYAIAHRLQLASEQRLRERNEELLRAKRSVEDFSHTAVHNLRQPVRAIDSYSAMMREELAGAAVSDDVRMALERTDKAAESLAAMLEEMLAWLKLGTRAPRRVRVDVTAMARAVLDDLQNGSPSREVDLSVDDGLEAEADPALTQIALRHLLTNAWQFSESKPKTTIRVAADRENGVTVFRVEDEGIGFDMTFADQLFRPFHSLHSPEDHRGIGAGLCTAHRIISMHQGRVWADASVGRGATFYFTLERD